MSLTESHFLLFILLIIIAEFSFSSIVDILNLFYKKDTNIPTIISDVYSEGRLQKARAYKKEQTRLSLISSSISVIVLLSAIYFGWLGKIDSYTKDWFDTLYLQSIAFFAILFIVNDILYLPFQFYSTFGIEANYGFNNTDLKTFILDKVKGYFLSILLGGGLFYVFLFLLNLLGEDFWWVFWIVMTSFLVITNYFYTTLILPLFNKLTPLEDGKLRQAILNYSDSVGFSIQNIYVIDGSKRSSKANAFFSGFGKKKKIVLYDTLIEKHTNDELVSVLAHEVGHYKKKHTIIGLLQSVFSIGLMLWLLSFMIFNAELSTALGAETLSIPLNLIGFGIIYTPLSLLLGLITNYLSRKHEYQADEFAAKTYKANALTEALKKLSADSLSYIYPHPLYVFLHYSHPPLLKRLQALQQ